MAPTKMVLFKTNPLSVVLRRSPKRTDHVVNGRDLTERPFAFLAPRTPESRSVARLAPPPGSGIVRATIARAELTGGARDGLPRSGLDPPVCRALSLPQPGPEPLVRCVRYRFRQLSCP